MTISDARARDKHLAGLAFAGLVLVFALSSVSRQDSLSSGARSEFSGARLFPALKTTPTEIEVFTATTRYHLTFDGTEWVLPEKAGFPVETDKIALLLEALQMARFEDARTRLVTRHDLLGLGDPQAGGNGARIALPDQPSAAVIIGRRNQTDYGRLDGDDQSWTLSRAFPALHSPGWWIDLESVGLPGSKPVSRVEITFGPNAQAQIIDARTPGLKGEDRLLLQAAAALSLQDVADDRPQSMTAFARHHVFYDDETELLISMIRRDGQIWARLSGDALGKPERATGRIFRLEPITASDLLP